MSITETTEPATEESSFAHSQKDEAPIKKEPEQILRAEIQEGMKALDRPAGSLLLSAFSAGLDIGFSMLLIAIVITRAGGDLPDIVLQLLIANAYAVGFIFVVIGRSELFTEQTTLAVLPVLGGRASLRKLVRLWVLVYTANLLGAACFAIFAVVAGPAMGSIELRTFGHIAHRVVDHSDRGILLGAIFAGWLMGLLSWLVAAGRETISVMVIVWLITSVIGFTNLHHVVLGSVEVLGGVFSGQGVGMVDFLRFLLWCTLGNIIGGSLFVALIKYGHARPETD